MKQPLLMRSRWQTHLKSWLELSPLAGDTLPLILSIAVGLATGIGAFIFIWLLRQLRDVSTLLRASGGALMSLAILAVAGALTGLIISRFASEAKGHGVPEVMEAIALKRGRIRPRVAIAKIIASAITIGSGGSAGREGPIVQVGATLGSTAGQWARLTDEQIGVLVAGGAAAGIAATFNAPMAGAMFALEVILGRFSNRYLGLVVISAVSANVVSRALLGQNPAFSVPAYPLNTANELPLYIGLAILCALGAVLFIKLLYGAEKVFDGWRVPLPVRTATGMVLTGGLALLAPEILGPGLEFIGDSVADDVTTAIEILALLFFLKLIGTVFTLGSGNSGGVFAPALFMGAMLGGIIGQVGHSLWPATVINPGAFALVGMAALFAGAARAPITAIIIVLEMSNDYQLILPLLMVVVLTTLLSDLMMRDSIYTLKLTLRGIRWQRGHDIDLLQSVNVGEALTADYATVRPEMSIAGAMAIFNKTHQHGLPIVDDQRHLRGIITLKDVDQAQTAQIPLDTPVVEIGSTTVLVTVYPDDPMYLALRRMNVYGLGRLPVVANEDDQMYLGVVRRADILRAYDIGLARKSIEQQHDKRLALRSMETHEFLEIEVLPNAPMIGQTLADFPCSDDCLLISILRHGQPMIAHGSTRIAVGDLVTAYANPEINEVVFKQFGHELGRETIVEYPALIATAKETDGVWR